jgi:hypothetical protein
MKKAANLKRRLEKLRDEPVPPVGIALQLDIHLHRTLKKQAAHEGLSLEIYIIRLLSSSIETGIDSEERVSEIEILA